MQTHTEILDRYCSVPIIIQLEVKKFLNQIKLIIKTMQNQIQDFIKRSDRPNLVLKNLFIILYDNWIMAAFSFFWSLFYLQIFWYKKRNLISKIIVIYRNFEILEEYFVWFYFIINEINFYNNQTINTCLNNFCSQPGLQNNIFKN